MLYRFRVEDGLSEAFTAEDAAEAFSSVNRKSLERLRAGETYTDRAGYVWVAEADVGADAQATRDERLARVAETVLPTLIQATLDTPEIAAAMNKAAVEAGVTVPQMVAVDAVAYAKALIAELDKQA